MHVSTITTNTSDEKTTDVRNTPTAKNDNRSNPRGDNTADQNENSTEQPADERSATQATMTIDDSSVQACYANLCRVSSTPEELILDLGLNPNPYAQVDTTVHLSQRIIMNHYTAKRLLAALSVTLQRHEQAFGVLEVDVNKRVRTT